MTRVAWTDELNARLVACGEDGLLAMAAELGVSARWLRSRRARLIRLAREAATDEVCRFGLISRIDYPAEGFRRGLLKQAARDLAAGDVQFVVLAGGLIDGRYVRTRELELRRRLTAALRQLKAVEKSHSVAVAPLNGERARLAAAFDAALDPAMSPAEIAAIRRDLDESAAVIEAKLDEFDREFAQVSEELSGLICRLNAALDELKPEKLATKLAELIPVFTNAAGETVKIHIFPSVVYDRPLGIDVAHMLGYLRPDDVRVYRSGGDKLSIRGVGEPIHVLVPIKAAWRSDYYSTPVERLIKDHKSHSADRLPGLYVVGCFGSTLTKPQGESVRPYVSAPALHRLGDNIVNENQVGVRIITLRRGERDPRTRNISYKDLILGESACITIPRGMPPARKRIVRAIIENGGPMTDGLLASATGIPRPELIAHLEAMRNASGVLPETWPGLRYWGGSQRWGLDDHWMRENLEYPEPPTAEAVDSVVAIGCPHLGSVFTDIPFMLEAVPRALLENDADTLALVGDLVEGLKHGLAVKGEVIGGMNVTAQERLAGRVFAKIVLQVAMARLDRKLASGATDDVDDVVDMIRSALVRVVIIAGNHDEWAQEAGFTPLAELKSVLAREVFRGLSAYLFAHDIFYRYLYELVESRIEEPVDGKTVLPSGLRMDLIHPHMGRSATTSLKPQEHLRYSSDCPVALLANFHVGMIVQTWDAALGERVCLEVGTLKRGTSFEHRKLKQVDFGFGVITVRSAGGRIISTDGAFYSAPATENSVTSPTLAFDTLVTRYGI